MTVFDLVVREEEKEPGQTAQGKARTAPFERHGDSAEPNEKQGAEGYQEDGDVKAVRVHAGIFADFALSFNGAEEWSIVV